MVLVTYKGQNYISFGNRKIVNGINDIPDDEFYKLMRYPTFRSRVTSNIFLVPFGFPLDDPKKSEADSKKKSSQDQQENKDTDEHDEDDEPTADRLSVKQTLKNIHKSDDTDYLKGLLETDDRQKVKEAAQKKLDSLESDEK